MTTHATATVETGAVIETVRVDRADIFEYAVTALTPGYAVETGDETSPEFDDLVDFLERTCAEAQHRCRLPKSHDPEWSPKFAWTVPALDCADASEWLSLVAAGHFLGSDPFETLDELGLTFLAARAMIA